jgi:hypothetical protein
MTRPRNIFRGSALKYAALGWPVFPLAEGAKVPMRNSDGFKSASTDRARIGAWMTQRPHNNIAAATGSVSGIIVIDLDPRSGSGATLRKLAEAGKRLPSTVTSVTPRGGNHLYYAYDARVTVSKANALGPGIDIKTDGGYIVLPPSWWSEINAAYRWLTPPRGNCLPSLPRWAIEALRPPPPQVRQPMKPIDLANLKGYRRQAMADLDEAMRSMAQLHDGRHDAPFKVAALLGKYVFHNLLTEADLESAVLSACAANGALMKYTPADIKSKIRRGLEKARNDSLPRLARVHPPAQGECVSCQA